MPVTETPNLPRDTDGRLTAYAWPGGYPVIYITDDGDVLCPACANGDNGSCASPEPDTSHGWRIIGYDIHYEGPAEQCTHCYEDIPSAYGDPDKDASI